MTDFSEMSHEEIISHVRNSDGATMLEVELAARLEESQELYEDFETLVVNEFTSKQMQLPL